MVRSHNGFRLQIQYRIHARVRRSLVLIRSDKARCFTRSRADEGTTLDGRFIRSITRWSEPKSSGKNNCDRPSSVSTRIARTFSPPFRDTTSCVCGSPVLCKILAVVIILAALRYYFRVTMCCQRRTTTLTTTACPRCVLACEYICKYETLETHRGVRRYVVRSTCKVCLK